MKKYLLILLVIFICGNTVFAQRLSPIETDRPDQTETSSIVPPHYFQVETGFSFERKNENTTSIAHPSALIKYGLTSFLEFRLIAEAISLRSGGGSTCTGIEPIAIGFKANIFHEDGLLPQTSLLAHLGFPYLATPIFRGTYYAPEFRLSMSHTLSDDLDLGYNLGAEWDGEHTSPAFIYTLTLGYSIQEKMGIFIEVYGFASDFITADHRFDGGFTYLLSNDTMLDLSGGIGLTNNAPQYFAAAGFSFRLAD